MARPRFVRYGRTRHLRIADAEDLRHVLTLTRTAWIATAAPISAFNMDKAFLAALDADGDGRILPNELREAIAWTLAVLADHSPLDAASDWIEPEAVAHAHPDGERIVRAVGIAREIAPESTTIGRTQLEVAVDHFAQRSAAEAQATDPPAILTSIRKKIDEFFFLARVAASSADPAASTAPYDDQVFQTLAGFRTDTVRETLAAMPLARPAQERLPLTGDVNPVYADQLSRLRSELVEPLFGPCEALDYQSWMALLERYTPPPVQERYAQDVACLKTALRLVLFQGNLLRFANSFVSCPDLYHPERHTAFEAGTLYLGGYAFTFSVRVPDRRFHAEISRTSNIFVIYAAVYGQGPPSYEIAVPVTSGTGRRLFRGKHGVFLDTSGREWHAEIVEIVTNPVSLMEAVLGPFRRIGEVITGRIEAATREAEAGLERVAAGTAPIGTPPPQAVQPAPQRPGLLGGAGAGIAGTGLPRRPALKENRPPARPIATTGTSGRRHGGIPPPRPSGLHAAANATENLRYCLVATVSACSRSARMSSMCSMPTESRTSSGEMLPAFCCSALSWLWVVVAG